MTLKSYVWGMRMSCLIAFAAWAMVVWFVDPQGSGFLGQMLFYACSFLFLSSLFILFLTWVRRNMGSEEMVLVNLGLSFREGILLALLSIILLVFQQNRILTWWDGALTVAGIFLVELYFLTRR